MKKITEKDIEKLKSIAINHNLNLLILFGSHAQNNNNESSDIDIAYYTRNTEPKLENSLFEDIISELKFEKVDLINIFSHHDTKLRQEIFSNGILIYEKEKFLFETMKGQALIDYIDFKRITQNSSEVLSKALSQL